MATTNNPENQNSKPHGLGDQVQISTDHNPLPWVIVENPGTDDESIYSEHASYWAAVKHAIKHLEPQFHEDKFDIMRRQDDGTLTTEF